MSYRDFPRNSRYNDGTTWFRADHAYYLALRRSLLRTQGLCVGVQRHLCCRVPQQLLYNFDILPVALEQRRKCVAKCMPRHLLVDSQFSSCRLNVVAHYRTQPDWLFPTLGSSAVGVGGPYIIGRLLVWGHLIPGQQIMSYILINRHQLSRCLRFDRAYVLVNQRPSHAYVEILEIEILPFQPGQFAPA